jgi:hypothetical protein
MICAQQCCEILRPPAAQNPRSDRSLSRSPVAQRNDRWSRPPREIRRSARVRREWDAVGWPRRTRFSVAPVSRRECPAVQPQTRSCVPAGSGSRMPGLAMRRDDQGDDHQDRSSRNYQDYGKDVQEDPVLACLPLPVLRREPGSGRMIARGRIMQIDASGLPRIRPRSARATEPNHHASRFLQPDAASMR